ncbi:hypothetical protein [Kribbella hippodromi]
MTRGLWWLHPHGCVHDEQTDALKPHKHGVHPGVRAVARAVRTS